MDTPTIGRIVIYRTHDERSVPALVAGTTETLPEGADEAMALDSDLHVHLHVFDPFSGSPARMLNVAADEDFGPVAGADESQVPNTWRWPVVVR